MQLRRKAMACGLALSVAAASPMALAGGGFGGRTGGFGGGGGFGGQYNGRQGRAGGQTNLRQALIGRMQQTAGFTDDEWTVVEPKLWNVATLEMLLNEGPLASYAQRFAGRGGNGAADPQAQLQSQEDPAVAQLSQELDQARQALESAASNPQENTASMQAVMAQYRGAVKKVEDALAAAQKDLRSVLTLQQESILMLAGYLS